MVKPQANDPLERKSFRPAELAFTILIENKYCRYVGQTYFQTGSSSSTPGKIATATTLTTTNVGLGKKKFLQKTPKLLRFCVKWSYWKCHHVRPIKRPLLIIISIGDQNLDWVADHSTAACFHGTTRNTANNHRIVITI